MARYSIETLTLYEDDPPPEGLHRIGGPAIGLPTASWPRYRGRCMQHAFTVDLAGVELEVPKLEGARAVSVFVDSYYELDVDSTEGITVVWLSPADVDAYPTTLPPSDFVPETLSENLRETMFTLEPDAEPDDEPDVDQCYLGGTPTWNDDGPPSTLPRGAFVLQVNSWSFPFARPSSVLRVFEDGGHIQRERSDSDAPVPWPQAIARSRQLVVLDEAPAADALQKWGGLPRGVGSYDWPKGMTHLFTYVPEEFPEGEEGVAVAVFGRLSKTTNWGEQPTFFMTYNIREADLDTEVEAPAGVPVLDERALELRPLPAQTSWRELQALSFAGPRPAWRDPGYEHAKVVNEPVLQLTSEILPNAPGRGSLCFLSGGYPWWMPEPGAPQAEGEPYQPSGTLYDEDTTAAVVVGYRIGFEQFSVVPERVEALERGIMATLRARDLELTLYVPGDTVTSRDSEIQAQFVLGRAIEATAADDWDPSSVDPAEIEKTLADFPPLDAAFWQAALAGCEGVTPHEAPAVYLLSWGPLSYAGLYVGVSRSKDDPEPPTHKFVANQNMEQEWSSEGIDGVSIASAEYSDIVELELSPDDLAKAEPLENPGYWLICRYD
jgi:hypothetical protein